MNACNLPTSSLPLLRRSIPSSIPPSLSTTPIPPLSRYRPRFRPAPAAHHPRWRGLAASRARRMWRRAAPSSTLALTLALALFPTLALGLGLGLRLAPTLTLTLTLTLALTPTLTLTLTLTLQASSPHANPLTQPSITELSPQAQAQPGARVAPRPPALRPRRLQGVPTVGSRYDARSILAQP